MNDPTEYGYTKKVLDNYYSRKNPETNKLLKKNFNEAEDWNNTMLSVFIFSLSELDDSLLMWRGYGADGNGVALEFDPHLISHNIRPVYYNEEEFIKDFTEKYIFEYFKEQPIKRKGTISFNRNSLHMAHQIASLNKHTAYQHEKEWRVLLLNEDRKKIEYVESNGVFKPYINLPIPMLALRKITFGPCCNYYLNIHSIKIYFIKNLRYGPKQ